MHHESMNEQPPVEHALPRSKQYASFEKAHAFALSLGLKNRKEWRAYIRGEVQNLPERPTEVPAHPDGIYRLTGWQGWRHWLGTQVRPETTLS